MSSITYLADPRDRQWAFQEQRIRATLATPSTRSACVPPLTQDQIEQRYWSAAKASNMRAKALRRLSSSPHIVPSTSSGDGLSSLEGRKERSRCAAEIQLRLVVMEES